jgi:hypothetical protein
MVELVGGIKILSGNELKNALQCMLLLFLIYVVLHAEYRNQWRAECYLKRYSPRKHSSKVMSSLVPNFSPFSEKSVENEKNNY